MTIDRDASRQGMLYPSHGMGCHPVRGVALARALTEAAQSRLSFVTGGADDAGRPEQAQISAAETGRAARVRLAGNGARRFQDCPTASHDTVDEDQTFVVERLRAAGMDQVVAVDLSIPELEIPVVRVIVPGLEPLWEIPGYQPGARARRVLEARFGDAS